MECAGANHDLIIICQFILSPPLYIIFRPTWEAIIDRARDGTKSTEWMAQEVKKQCGKGAMIFD
jgi:hypothetical protein